MTVYHPDIYQGFRFIPESQALFFGRLSPMFDTCRDWLRHFPTPSCSRLVSSSKGSDLQDFLNHSALVLRLHCSSLQKLRISGARLEQWIAAPQKHFCASAAVAISGTRTAEGVGRAVRMSNLTERLRSH